MTSKRLLITGTSTGFGRAFAEAALAAGHQVVGTVRTEAAGRDLEQLAPGRARAVVLDVTHTAQIPPAIERLARDGGGPIDVLINNAGYGSEGVIEETPLDELRRQFEVNVFGAVAMIQAVLPSMRARRTGQIINVTSMGGYITMPGLGYYHGSKFALEGITETLAKEVAHLGIRVTALAPGGFRTEWAGRSMTRTPRSIADYDEVFDPLRAARQARSGKQAGDPRKAAQVVVDLLDNPAPPVHLVIGSDALQLVRDKLSSLGASIEQHAAISRSTDVYDG